MLSHTAPKGMSILLAEDSTIVRSMIARTLEQDPFIETVYKARDGKEAVELYEKHRPDFALLDIYMPEMDGVEALERIIKHDSKARILVYSAISKRDGKEVVRALTLGALDFLQKPNGSEEVEAFYRTLLEKLKNLYRRPTASPRPSGSGSSAGSAFAAARPPADVAKLKPYPMGVFTPKVLAIGSSTGGPKALFEVLKPLHNRCKVPIVITQHMPKTFTGILAEHIHNYTKFEACEGADGMMLEPGKVYVAPGDYHMRFTKTTDGVKIKLDQGPQVNFCRPAVDPMFDSLLEIYPRHILAVILTGMGSDGAQGAKNIIASGHNVVLAQDEETSAVWGMPGAVAKAGACNAILPLPQIGPKLVNLLKSCR